MGDVARYQFAKDCDELLHRDVKELGHFDIGYLEQAGGALDAMRRKAEQLAKRNGVSLPRPIWSRQVTSNCVP